MIKQTLISPEEARILALQSQGLLEPKLGNGKKAVLTAIEQLGYVQIDTLSVVARAHHHTLWSRLPDYKENFLTSLLEKDKAIFEYWSHAASYLPMKDYRFSLLRKKAYSNGKSHWFGQDKKMNLYVLDRIKAEGPLQSKDFEHKRNGPGNWYEWKPAKQALEQLFMEGKLMVAKRQGFQKVYDLTEHVLPLEVNRDLPDTEEFAEHMILTMVNAHGIVNENEFFYLRNHLKEPVIKVLNKLLKEGKLVEIIINGLDKTIFISSGKKIKELKKIELQEHVHLLSPFDNIVIQRKRLLRLFDFDYMMECYVPEAKRKYGYFTLPVLYSDKFVARMDPKANRLTKTFYIKSMHFEKGFKPKTAFNILFASKLKSFALFNGCTKFIIEKADAKWKKEIMNLLKI
ncbi:MAG: winged helix-turn-helix domain-containing protein [Bacteroidetes bacterium]|nr:winged helix-turn-helix domain-containing protein [Bacteroidota bacterium]